MDDQSAPEHQTRDDPPRGKGEVLAYSAASGRWRKVNCRYVIYNAKVYPRWKATSEFRWTRSPDSASSNETISNRGET